MDFRHYVFASPYFEWLLRGVGMTMLVALVSGLCAAAIGGAIVKCHLSASAASRTFGAAFVVVFRNLPLVPLLLFLTFAVPGLWRDAFGRPFFQGYEIYLLVLGLALNTGAYFAEILFAGVTGVERGQVDVGRTLGMRRGAIRRHIVYPQAVRIVAPALASRFIHNVKNSTLAIVVPLPVEMMEVVGQAGRIAGQTFSWAEPLLFAAAVHLLLALGLGRLLNAWASEEQAKIRANA